jgi:hypothetical protein
MWHYQNLSVPSNGMRTPLLPRSMATERNERDSLDRTTKANRRPLRNPQAAHTPIPTHACTARHIESRNLFSASSIIQRMGGMVHEMVMQELLP